MQAKSQNLKSKIVIVGAGPAGTSLAVRLAKEDFEVILIEREKFPRHKLCGEFISPECLEHFRELGVLDEMLTRGGDRISQTIFYAENGNNVTIPSEWFGGSKKGALGLSRAEMDLRLMEKAKESGVEVLEESQVVGLLFENEEVCGVKFRNSSSENREVFSDLIIDATGRAKILVKLAEKEISRKALKGQRKNKEEKSKIQNSLVGFKAHLENVHLPKGRCEIYFFRGGYGGLNYIENGIANHCFLVKSELVKEYKGDVEKILSEVIFQNERAKEILEGAKNRFDWLAVSVDGFGTKNLSPAKNLVAVGDASAFIDPFTGSGMLMALEGAKILANVISENGNENSFTVVQNKYKILHEDKFKRRLRICSFVRHLAFMPKLARIAIFALGFSEKAREFLARSTRQTKFDKRT